MHHETEMIEADADYRDTINTLEDRLEAIKMAHEKMMNNELERHKGEYKRIVRDAEDQLERLVQLAQDTDEAREDREDARRELRKIAVKALRGMSSRQRVSVGKDVTLRDGDIYIYDSSNRAGISRIRNSRSKFTEVDCIDTDCEAFRVVMDALDRIELRSGSYRTEKQTKIEHEFDEPVIEAFDEITYDSQSSDKLSIGVSGEYTNFSLPLHRVEEVFEYFDLDADERRLKCLVAMDSQLTAILNEAKDTYESQTERRNNARQQIQKAAAKHLVANSI